MIRPAPAYSAVPVGTVRAILALRRPMERDLYWVIYCLPFCDKSKGWAGSLRQLEAAYELLVGSKVRRASLRDALEALERAHLVTTQRDKNGLRIALKVGVDCPHTRTNRRTRKRGPGKGWRGQSIPTPGDNQSPVAGTINTHTRNRIETERGIPDTSLSLSVSLKDVPDPGPQGAGPALSPEEIEQRKAQLMEQLRGKP